MTIRKAEVMGSFYPSNSDEIEKYFSNIPVGIESSVKAIISPHAGYVYSGETANLAYLRSSQKDKRVIVIGPSHRVALDGASVALFDDYETPIGNLEIDSSYSQELIDNYDFLNFYEEVHREHSTETQMPFIKHYFPNAKVVEIVYGNISNAKLAEVIKFILKDPDNFLVISSDLSHFYPLDLAKEIDRKTINAIEAVDSILFTVDCDACGGVGIKAFLKVAQEQYLKSEIIDYRTSYEVNNDSSNVVGYLSALFFIPKLCND
jgi:AmmeMemoRadiSam system protein B